MDCPLIDADRPECSERMNMGHLDDAFGLCTDKYFLCPLYLEFSRSSARTGRAPVAADAAVALGRRVKCEVGA